MSEPSEPRPDRAHGFDIQRLKRPKPRRVHVDRAVASAFWLFEFLIPQEHTAGDDAGLKLEEDDRPRLGIESGRAVTPSPAGLGQIFQKTILLHLGDALAAEAGDL